jgi:hypothetical protein
MPYSLWYVISAHASHSDHIHRDHIHSDHIHSDHIHSDHIHPSFTKCIQYYSLLGNEYT